MKKKNTPCIGSLSLTYKNKIYDIEYFIRRGKQETIVFVHGLGGCKENFLEACKSDGLSEHTLIAFDHPGTGNSSYYEDAALQVDDLACILTLFTEKLKLDHFILCGASMGGLVSLLYLRDHSHRVKAFVNIEGNLMPEDCMFSSKVVMHEREEFINTVFPALAREMKIHPNAGYHIIGNNLEMNTVPAAYYGYSFQTVAYSGTGELLKDYKDLLIPTMFIYGEENHHLSYLKEFDEKHSRMIPGSNHFVFYDNPSALYLATADFISSL